MKRRQRRGRIVGLLAIFSLIALVATSGWNPLDRWLGWSAANTVWMAVSVALILAIAWHLLGFFIDRDESRNDRDNDGAPLS